MTSNHIEQLACLLRRLWNLFQKLLGNLLPTINLDSVASPKKFNNYTGPFDKITDTWKANVSVYRRFLT